MNKSTWLVCWLGVFGCGHSTSKAVDAGLNAADMNDAAVDTGPALSFSTLSLLAGQVGGPGYLDGVGTSASFNEARGIVSDGAGTLYVADTGNHLIRKIVLATGAVTTIAGTVGQSGSTDGIGAAARFHDPERLALDGAGNLYVSDPTDNTIRKVVLATADVTTLVGTAGVVGNTDGMGAAASFSRPTGLACDGAGNLYVVDGENSLIRKVVLATRVVTTFAGHQGGGDVDGKGVAAGFALPFALVFDGAGNLYVGEFSAIRKVVLATAEVTTVSAKPAYALTFDKSGELFLIDSFGLDEVTLASMSLRHVALGFYPSDDVAEDAAGNLYVADRDAVSMVAPSTGVVTTVFGSNPAGGTANGVGSAASFNSPAGLALDAAGHLYVADTKLRQIDVSSGAVTTLAGTPQFDNIAVDDHGNLYGTASVIDEVVLSTLAVTGVITPVDMVDGGPVTDDGGVVLNYGSAPFFCADSTGALYVASDQNKILHVTVATGAVSILAGGGAAGSADGVGSAAHFDGPAGIVCDGAGNLYVADQNNQTIRKIVIATGAVTTVAGSAGLAGSDDGKASAARFTGPRLVAYDGAGHLFVGSVDATIRSVDLATGIVTTILGKSGEAQYVPGAVGSARIGAPLGLAYGTGPALYISNPDVILVLR